MRIGIIIEVKKREITFLSILKKRLEIEGHNVKLISFRYKCHHQIKKFRPDVLMVNGLRHVMPYAYEQMYLPKKQYGTKIVCYYSEQLGRANSSIAYSYDNKEILNNVDMHIVWGPKFAKDLVSLGVPKNKIYIIGYLQYDINRYFKYTSNELKNMIGEKYNLDPNKKWILVADNIIKIANHHGLYSQRRNEFNVLTKKIAHELPNCEIIFRTHPETSPEENIELREEFISFPQIHFINDGHLFYWIHIANALVIWVSTSCIHALLDNVPVFSYKTSDSEMDCYWQKELVDLYTDVDKLVQDLKMTIESASTHCMDDRVKKFINDWYYRVNGLSYERLVYLMNKMENIPFVPYIGTNFGLKSYIKAHYSRFHSFLGDVLFNRFRYKRILDNEIIAELENFDIKKIPCTISERISDFGVFVEDK